MQAWSIAFRHVPPGTPLTWIAICGSDWSDLTRERLAAIHQAIADRHGWPLHEVWITGVTHIDRALAVAPLSPAWVGEAESEDALLLAKTYQEERVRGGSLTYALGKASQAVMEYFRAKGAQV